MKIKWDKINSIARIPSVGVMGLCSAMLFFPYILRSQARLEVGVTVDGKEITMPWNGGYNAPQFSNIDLNRDGITDMISFDRQGDQLRTYIHLPASGRWILDWSYTGIFPPVVDWVLVADYNGDGVEDLFTSSSATGVAGVTVYRGAYTGGQWSFTKISDRGRDYLQVPAGGDLTNLYVSWEDTPAVSDIDGDGDLDILSFEPGGSYITYYSNQSVENGWGRDSLRYNIQDFCWGKILENELTEEVYLSDDPDICSDGNFTGGEVIVPRHAGSTIMTLDQDFDGDQDAWVGDISSRRLVFLHNGLNQQEAWITEQESHWPLGDTAVLIPYFVGAYKVQLDDDPEPEIIAAVNSRSLAEDRQSVWRYDDNPFTDGPLEYHLTEKGFFQNEMIDLGSFSRPAVADVNADGLPDLVVGGYFFEDGSLTRSPSLWLFLNQGTAAQPYFQLITRDYLGMSQYGDIPTFDFTPAFGDINGNGSVDLVVGEQNGKLFFFKNEAPGGSAFSFQPAVYPYMNIGVGVSSTPQLADINGDGLRDLVIGERTGNADNTGRCSNLNYYENVGTVGNAVFGADVTLAPNTQCFGRVLFDIPIGLPQYSTPVIVAGQDGLLLMTGKDPGELAIYADLNKGKTGAITLVDDVYGGLDFGIRSSPALADLNADGFYELIVGNQRGGLEMLGTEIEVGTVGTEEPVPEADKPYTITQLSGDGIYEVTWKDGRAGSVRVVDMWGRVLLDHPRTDSFIQVDMTGLPSGVYFLELAQGKRHSTEKIMRVRP